MISVTRFVSGLPLAGVPTVCPRPQTVFLFYALVFFLCSEGFLIIRSRHLRALPLFCAVLCVLLAALSLANPALRRNTAALTFVDVGQGDCLHIRTQDGRNYLVDGGGSTDYNVGKNTLLPYLLKNGVGHLDGVFVSHLHQDHFGGIRELSEYMDIGRVYVYDANRYRPEEVCSGSAINPADVVYLARGDRVSLGANVYVDVLYPPRTDEVAERAMIGDGEDENLTSLLLRVDYEGVRTLMTGDMGEVGEKATLALGGAGISADILKVGHHGSRFSTTEAFLDAVAPDYAVIQSGNNAFGHPTSEVITKLSARDIILLRNDLSGAVRFSIKEGKIVEIATADGRIPAD